MRAIFYAPMKSPNHPVPSGDRTMARLLVQAFQQVGCDVDVVDGFSSYHGEPALYAEQKCRLLDRWARECREMTPPDLWVTYHSYYKSPDVLGPLAQQAWGMPYLVFEPSYAPSKTDTPWREALADAKRSFDRADRLFVMKEKDWRPLAKALGSDRKLKRFPPFVDPSPFERARKDRAAAIDRLRRTIGGPPTGPIILCTAMMRPGVKCESYRLLAAALGHVTDLDWHLVIAGDGPGKPEIEQDFAAMASRTTFLGAIQGIDLYNFFAAADVFAWPGLGEAYGMAYLEAGAAALPSVAVEGPGVAEVIRHDETGFLAEGASSQLFAQALRALLEDKNRRRRMGRAAESFVLAHRSLDSRLPALRESLFSSREAEACRSSA